MTRAVRHYDPRYTANDPTIPCCYTVGRQYCNATPTELVTAVCVHEHMATHRVCQTHRKDLQKGAICTDCFYAPDGHICTVRIIVDYELPE